MHEVGFAIEQEEVGEFKRRDISKAQTSWAEPTTLLRVTIVCTSVRQDLTAIKSFLEMMHGFEIQH